MENIFFFSNESIWLLPFLSVCLCKFVSQFRITVEVRGRHRSNSSAEWPMSEWRSRRRRRPSTASTMLQPVANPSSRKRI